MWQRAWIPSVGASVASPPEGVTGLRVLAGEVGGDGEVAWPEVDVSALAQSRRPITAVLRIDGARPMAELSLAPLLARVEDWRAGGADIRGIEIDHDCATAALGDYAAWLARVRPSAPLRLSATALPTWASSPQLAAVADAVDELVVQVHAVRAPRLFEAGEARRWLDDMSAALGGRSFRVALPTYRVRVAGAVRRADPAALADFVADLRARPVAGLRGVVWFRLPVRDDGSAWSATTLEAVIAGTPLVADVTATLVSRSDGSFDVVLENRGTVAAAWPDLQVRGGVADADLIGGYALERAAVRRWRAPERRIGPGQRAVVGWATGSEMRIDAL